MPKGTPGPINRRASPTGRPFKAGRADGGPGLPALERVASHHLLRWDGAPWGRTPRRGHPGRADASTTCMSARPGESLQLGRPAIGQCPMVTSKHGLSQRLYRSNLKLALAVGIPLADLCDWHRPEPLDMLSETIQYGDRQIPMGMSFEPDCWLVSDLVRRGIIVIGGLTSRKLNL